MAFTLRTSKGSALTHAELDANFTTPSYGQFGSATGAATGEVRASGNITAYATSDRKFKYNIQDIPGAIGIASHIGGKTYTWTQEYIDSRGGVVDGYYVVKDDYGVIAQDVQEVFPLAVRAKEDGSLAVDYEKLVSVAFAAIKDLQDKIQLCEERIKKLENR